MSCENCSSTQRPWATNWTTKSTCIGASKQAPSTMLAAALSEPWLIASRSMVQIGNTGVWSISLYLRVHGISCTATQSKDYQLPSWPLSFREHFMRWIICIQNARSFTQVCWSMKMTSVSPSNDLPAHFTDLGLQTDILASNLMLGVGDNSVLTDFEQAELTTLSPRKKDADRRTICLTGARNVKTTGSSCTMRLWICSPWH